MSKIHRAITYVYMTQENEEYTMSSKSMSESKIIYSDQPRIETYSKIYSTERQKFWFIEPFFDRIDHYKIYVPEGTIQQNFIINLQ